MISGPMPSPGSVTIRAGTATNAIRCGFVVTLARELRDDGP
jgi:hypothetical protein